MPKLLLISLALLLAGTAHAAGYLKVSATIYDPKTDPFAGVRNQKICAIDTRTLQEYCSDTYSSGWLEGNSNVPYITLSLDNGRYFIRKCARWFSAHNDSSEMACTFYGGRAALDSALAVTVFPNKTSSATINANVKNIALDCVQDNGNGTFTAVGKGFGTSKGYLNVAGYDSNSASYVLAWTDSQITYKKPNLSFAALPLAVVSKSNGASNKIDTLSSCF